MANGKPFSTAVNMALLFKCPSPVFSHDLEPLTPGFEFHYRFARFCLSSHIIRNLRLADNEFEPSQIDILRKSISNASDFCQLSLELGPSSREAARYMSDSGFVMISFSCLFIIRACELFRSAVQTPDEFLGKVKEVAQLMRELSISSSHGPSFQSENITSKLKQAGDTSSAKAVENGSITSRRADQPSPDAPGQDSYFMDPQWEIPDFFPGIPRL